MLTFWINNSFEALTQPNNLNFFLFYFLTLQYCIGFAIYQNDKPPVQTHTANNLKFFKCFVYNFV